MVVWRSGMSHGSAGATGSMDVADGDFLRADRCGASNRARPRSGTPRPAARPGMALAASFLESPTHLGPRQWRRCARQRARQARTARARARSERARARTRRPECSDLDVGRLPGARPGLRSVPWPEIPHETQDMPLAASRAGSSPPEAFAAPTGFGPRPPEVAAADGRLAYGNVTRIRGGRGSGLRKAVSERAGRCGGRRTRGLDVARPYRQAAAGEIYSPERAAVFNCPVRISRPPNLPR